MAVTTATKLLVAVALAAAPATEAFVALRTAGTGVAPRAHNTVPRFVFGEMFKKLGEVQKEIDEQVWDFAYGRKERIWAQDRRPEDQRNVRAGPGPDSQLSWGGAATIEIFEAEFEARQDGLDQSQANSNSQPLGAAAIALVGESAKDNIGDDEAAAEIQDYWRQSQAPDLAAARTISSAVELAELCFAKYGRYHDMTILRNSGQVAFNIYGPSLGQRSFSYTEQQFLEKLEIVIAMLNDFDQAWFVKQFLLSPIVPRNGLPSTPRYDTAVTLRLNTSPTWKYVDKDRVEEWFKLREMGI